MRLRPRARRERGSRAVPAREPAAGERAPRDHAHAVALAGGENVALDAPDEHRVGRLLAAEPLPASPLRDPLRLDDRIRREGRAPEIPDLPGTDEVGERAERLVDVGARRGAVHLVEVDPVRVQAAEARLDLLHDPAARVAAPVRALAHPAVELRREHDLVAPPRERLPDDLLVLAGRVDVRRVDDVDPGVQCCVDDPDALGVVGVPPRAEHHRAEAQLADLDPGSTELPVLHRRNASGHGLSRCERLFPGSTGDERVVREARGRRAAPRP